MTRPWPEPIPVDEPALFDSGVWTWSRDRRFPHLAAWFKRAVARDNVLVCDLTVLELTRVAPNASRAQDRHRTLAAFDSVQMPHDAWAIAKRTQLALSANGDHRRVPPTDLLIAAAAQAAGVPLIHYDRDYARIGAVSDLDQCWFVPEGSLAPPA